MIKRTMTFACAALWTGVALGAGAASAQTPPPNPCEAPEYRTFDFWIGEWTVFDPNGNVAGTNKITSEESGCMLLEHWTSSAGGTGQSYNFFDPKTKKMRQVWVSRGAVIDYDGGLNDDGQMVLEGEIAYHNGTLAPFRGTWTANDDDTVTQYFQQFNNETEEWNDWFTGTYKRTKDLPDE